MVKTMVGDNERLSALMDGESVDKAFLQDLTADADMQETWRNYHLIGDIMRGDVPDEFSKREWNIADSVAAAIELEPAHSRLDSAAEVSPLQEAQPSPHQARRYLPKWFTQLGQVGIAACVSLAVIFGVQQYGQDNAGATNGASDQIPVLQTIPFAGNAEPVSLSRENIDDNHSRQSRAQEQRRRVNAMLQDYELQLRLNSYTNHQ